MLYKIYFTAIYEPLELFQELCKHYGKVNSITYDVHNVAIVDMDVSKTIHNTVSLFGKYYPAIRFTLEKMPSVQYMFHILDEDMVWCAENENYDCRQLPTVSSSSSIKSEDNVATFDY
jgi:hypothetical protein